MKNAAKLPGFDARASGAWWGGYAVAVVGTAGAAWLRWELGKILGQDLPPYITFYPIIILSSITSGTGAGLLATVIAAGLVDYLFLRPAGLGVERPVDMAGLAIFSIVNLLMSMVGGGLRNARRRSNEHARELSQTVNLLDQAIIYMRDAGDRVTHWNSGCQRLFGFTREQALGKVSHELLHTRFPEPLENLRTKLAATGHWEGELEHTSCEGRKLVVASEWILRREASTQASTTIETNVDITERKAAQELLRQSEERFRTLATVTNQVVWISSPNGEPMPDSPSWREFTGRSNEQWTGWNWLAAIHPDDRERVSACWRSALEHVQPYRDEYRLLHRSGVYRHVQARAVPVRTSSGMVREWIGTLTDITDIKRAEVARKKDEEALRQARDELARANIELEQKVHERTAKLQETVEELEHFSYTITHDMRAPLRAIQGFAHLILEGEGADSLDLTAKAHLNRIKVAAARMDGLITDALQYSKILRREFALKPVDVGVLVQSLLDSYPSLQPPRAQVSVDGNFPLVLGNEAGLTQCFSNLLTNAVNFVAPGTAPQVRVWAEPRGEFVRIWVGDNGIGIPKQYHERIWEMFQRLKISPESTGIGLALVHKVVSRMGGRVGVESEPGEGSRFWIELRAIGEPITT